MTTKEQNKMTFDEKVEAIIKNGLIEWVTADCYFVTSQTDVSKGYEVLPLYNHCQCKQHELFPHQDCKHLAAVKKVRLDSIKKAVEEAVIRASQKIGGVNISND